MYKCQFETSLSRTPSLCQNRLQGCRLDPEFWPLNAIKEENATC